MKRLKEFFRKLVPLRPDDTTARITLERTLDKADRIKAVAIVIQWDDDTYDCDWSTMKASELCMALIVLQEQTRQIIVPERG